jgi:stress response protein YsnF
VSQELKSERVTVSRVPINRYVEAPPQVRTEGDVTIIPVLEEVLIVEKKLLLREEIHLQRTTITETVTETVPVRKHRAVVRSEPENS